MHFTDPVNLEYVEEKFVLLKACFPTSLQTLCKRTTSLLRGRLCLKSTHQVFLVNAESIILLLRSLTFDLYVERRF